MERRCKACGRIFDGTSDTRLCPGCRLKTQQANVYRPRVCTVCGASFVGTPRALYCPACRAKIKSQRDREHRRTGPARPLGSVDHCLRCGKEYVVRGGLQKYCADCTWIAQREADRIKSKEWNRTHKTNKRGEDES